MTKLGAGTTNLEVPMRLRHFRTEEFVPPDVFHALGARSLLVMDRRILKTVTALRENLDRPVTINNWVFGGNIRWAGFRNSKCTTGAFYSQHKFGRAVDCRVEKMTPDEVRRYILNNRSHFPYVTAMEDGVPWVHLDCRALEGDDIFIFTDKGKS